MLIKLIKNLHLEEKIIKVIKHNKITKTLNKFNYNSIENRKYKNKYIKKKLNISKTLKIKHLDFNSFEFHFIINSY